MSRFSVTSTNNGFEYRSIRTQFLWTRRAEENYRRLLQDPAIVSAIDDLLAFIDENPARGVQLDPIPSTAHQWFKNVAAILKCEGFIPSARLVAVGVPANCFPAPFGIIASVLYQEPVTETCLTKTVILQVVALLSPHAWPS